MPSKTQAFIISILIIIQGGESVQCSMQKENEHIIAIKNKFIGWLKKNQRWEGLSMSLWDEEIC